MTATDLLGTLRRKGLTVAADGDTVTVRPRDLLTEVLRAAIRTYKSELLAELPRYRWLVDVDGEAREVCYLPEMTIGEMRACYSGARFRPLLDAAAKTVS